MPTAPQRAAAPTRTFFNHGPEESEALPTPLWSHGSPTITPRKSPLLWKSGYRDSGVRGLREHNSHAKQNPDPRWSTGQHFRFIEDFLIGKSGMARLCFTAPFNSQTPNSELTPPVSHYVLWTRFATSSSFARAIGDRGIAISPVAILLYHKNPNPRFSDATCPHLW
jgi:hypothetical protein